MALVGRVARPHGLRGQVIVNVDTDFPESRFRPGAELFVDRDGKPEAVVVATVRFHRERPVVAFAGVGTIAEAEALAGRELRVPVDSLEPLPAGTYYRHDLIGCRVETREGMPLGVVRDVEDAQGNCRIVVAARGGEVQIPLVAAICTTIDPGAGRIVIDPPEGLLELNT
jgi:16S rRNA processing protein RimM